MAKKVNKSKAKPKPKPLKKRPNDLLIAVYQNITQHVCTIKKRHWVLLTALAASHIYVLENAQAIGRRGIEWQADLLWAHVGIALFVCLILWHGSYALRDARVKQKRAQADLVGRDPGLSSLLGGNSQDEGRGDILIYLSALYAPLFSIALLLKEINPEFMLRMICLAAMFQLLDIIMQKSPKLKPPTFFAISLAIFIVEVWYIYLLS